MSKDDGLERALNSVVNETKRKTLARLITGAAFVAPIVASYAVDLLTISPAHATGPGGSGIPITSDRRLKRDTVKVGTHSSGIGLYRFTYIWGGPQYVGVMAQEVLEVAPEAVVTGAGGFMRVDYQALGIEMPTYATWCERNAAAAHA